MKYYYRFFVNGFCSAINSIMHDSSTGYPPVPNVGNNVYIDSYECDTKTPPDWTPEDLDYDFYKVERVDYNYSPDLVLIDIFLVGMYFED